MPHQVLECLRVHARLRHVAAVGMAADMGRDVRHLHAVDIWYCRLYGIMMLQHLDAWEMPSAEAFQESLLGFTA